MTAMARYVFLNHHRSGAPLLLRQTLLSSNSNRLAEVAAPCVQVISQMQYYSSITVISTLYKKKTGVFDQTILTIVTIIVFVVITFYGPFAYGSIERLFEGYGRNIQTVRACTIDVGGNPFAGKPTADR